jgi:dihydropteroate synthase
MQQEPRYQDVVREVRDFLAAQLYEAMDAGIAAEAIIIDPGIGFGKTIDHNLRLLRGLPVLAALGQPLLVGASRKTFIGKILNGDAEFRLEGSLAAAVASVLAGANILRVHDVLETCKAVRIADAIRFGFPQ